MRVYAADDWQVSEAIRRTLPCFLSQPPVLG
jgi:hypothetical protein